MVKSNRVDRTLAILAVVVLVASHVTDVAAITAGLVISEFRLRGPNGANDEFVEIYNGTGADHTVTATGTGTGYGVAASDGVLRCSIPNGTIIPNKGHYLCTNSVGYSMNSYPAGNGTFSTADATYAADIPDNAGIALFSTNVPGEFTLGTRIDAVGSTSEANTLYKEGTGYPALTPFSIEYSFYRNLISGLPRDTNNNASDFLFVDTNGTSAGAGQRLGAPGPENLASPVGSDNLVATVLDPAFGQTVAPNRVRDFTNINPQNSVIGTLAIRRKFTNVTGTNVTRLRFRIIDVTTFPSPAGTADLRAITSTPFVQSVTGVGNVTVQGLTLELPSSPINGGGINSTLSAGTVAI